MKFVTSTAWTLAACILGSVLAPGARAQDEQAARMRAALASPARPAEEKERDAVRKPVETVQFLGIETGDTVIDVIAAGGWFTEVLSAAVGPSGKVLAQNPEFFARARASPPPRRHVTTGSATCSPCTASSRRTESRARPTPQSRR
jgi:predicted methyltransferase